MKINYLQINEYKNLKAKAVFGDLSNCTNYAALIGLNGSGKSNVLEAVSKIFASLYNNKSTSFSYRIGYSVKGRDVTAIDGIITADGGQVIKKKNYRNYLPDQIIACYSGEELRMWESIFEPFYDDFVKSIKKNIIGSKQRLVYVNKYSWNIALISLLCSEDAGIKKFLSDYIGINSLDGITINFTFDPAKYGNYANNEVMNLINRLNPNKLNAVPPINVSEIASYDIGTQNNLEFIRKIFFYFYTASMPKKDKIIKDIGINFNGLTVQSLSEGEKKLLLIKCIMDVLSDENSLVLLDEPDAYMHISRKKEIKNFVNKEGYFTILTTHSPSLLHSLEEKNIRILSNGDDGLEVIPAEKVKTIERLSDGAFTLMDATLAFSTTKDILLVEGTNDYKYINKAIEVLKGTKAPKYNSIDFTIVNCGGAGNVAALLEQIILPYLSDRQLCIATFDSDEGGRNGIKSISKILDVTPKANIKCMTHPKIYTWDISKDFVLEDYFPITAYKPRYEAKVASASTFKSLTSIQNPKKIIEDCYQTFADSDYDNFGILFDELIRLKIEFHATASPPTLEGTI